MTFPSVSGGSPTDFTSKYGSLNSGTSSVQTSSITFLGGGTSYVAFHWFVSVDHENTLKVKFTMSDNSTVTISNCRSGTTGCVGGYVPSNWLLDLLSGLLGGLFGSGSNHYATAYLSYVPSGSLKISKVDFIADSYVDCALFIFCTDVAQQVMVDNLSYVDATAKPHHLELTTTVASAPAGSPVTFTVKACADGASPCAPYTSGVTASLTLSGTGMTASYPSGQGFSIAAGNSQTSLTASITPAGTATASLSSLTPAPSNGTAWFCGIGGAAAASGNPCTLTITATAHHLELTAPSNSALTCSPVVFTVRACANADCSALFTGGISGSLAVSGTGLTVNYPAGAGFSIGSGNSATTVSAQVTTTGTASATLTGTGLPPLYCGMGVAAASNGSCDVTLASAGLLFSVSNHRSNVQQSITVSAVRASDNAAVCTPAFASVTKAVSFKCGYTNPASGGLPVLLGGTALNSTASAAAACDATGQSVNLAFNASGVATTTVQYADAGTVNLSATYTGAGTDAGLSMIGNTSFTAIPVGFAVANLPTGNVVAGSSFGARVNALNASGAITPNFGRETSPQGATLAFLRRVPGGVDAVDGVFSGSVTGFGTAGGFASTANLSWTEVGKGDLAATLGSGNYLGTANTVTGTSCAAEGGTCVLPAGAVATVFYGANAAFKIVAGLSGSVPCNSTYFGNPLNGVTKHCSYTVTGGTVGSLASATGALGPFIPHHFDLALTQGCGAFTYSGQPFGATVTARNAANGTTLNYDGSGSTSPNQAKAVTLAAVSNGGVGSFNGTGTVAASSFSAGVALVSTPAFSFTTKLTSTQVVTVGATNADGVSSTGFAQGILSLRSGRLKASNVFGPGSVSLLTLPVQAQYWTGRAWVLNDQDSCTSVPAAAVALSNYRDSKGATTAAWATNASALTITNGHGGISFSAPSASGTGSVDAALNLGGSVTDQSCLSSHPASVGGATPWLRSQYGSSGACMAAFDRDPSARITFGVYSPESRKNMYARETF